jgi:hypothetical protein
MIINTASGNVTINKKSPYGKWLQGWISSNGFTGAQTLSEAWNRAVKIKVDGCSWYALGRLMASEQKYGKSIEEVD